MATAMATVTPGAKPDLFQSKFSMSNTGSRTGYPAVPQGQLQEGFALPVGFQNPMVDLGASSLLPAHAGGYYQQPPRPLPYRDFSRLSSEDVSLAQADDLPSGGAGGGKEPPFPVKLHRILSNHPEFKEIITWLPHGRSWRVLKPKAFEEKVIPLYFRHSKYASFMRQVNGWGFKRMTQGPDHNSYYHEMFLRGMPHLCNRMRRSSRQKHGTLETDVHPDFYRISLFAPLPGSEDANSVATRGGSNRPAVPAGLRSGSESEAASRDGGEGNNTAPSVVSSSSAPGSNVATPPQSSGLSQLKGVPDALLGPNAMVGQLPQDAALAHQLAMGQSLGPGMGMPYASDPAAAAAQYERSLLAGNANATLMAGGPGAMNLLAYQNQALQNQALLAQLQTQMLQAQAQGQAPSGSSNANKSSPARRPGAKSA